jgi:hypothetical protein
MQLGDNIELSLTRRNPLSTLDACTVSDPSTFDVEARLTVPFQKRRQMLNSGR